MVNYEIGGNDASLKKFLTCVHNSNLIGDRFKSDMSEGVGARNKCGTKSFFEGWVMLHSKDSSHE